MVNNVHHPSAYHTELVMSLTDRRQFRQIRGGFGGFGVVDATVVVRSGVALMVPSDCGWRRGFFLGIANNNGGCLGGVL